MSGKVVGWAMEQVTGSPVTKLLLVKLADNANEEGVCWPSLALIIEHTELSRRTVQDHLTRLEVLGLIEIERREGGNGTLPNRYHLQIPAPARRPKGVQDARPPGAQVAHPGVQVAREGVQDLHEGVQVAPPYIEEPSSEPSMNPHSNAPAGAGESVVAALGEGSPERWPEFLAAVTDTWPEGMPLRDAGPAQAEFVRQSKVTPADTLIACCRAHGAAETRRKSARGAMRGEFVTKLPSNWLREGAWKGYVGDVEAQARQDGERTLAVARTRAALGDGLVEILRKVGLTEIDLALLDGTSFEKGPPAMFVVPRPFPASRLRQHQDKLERAMGESLRIVEAGKAGTG
jgi:DNA-binding transcriptional ArsR family regulator